MPAAVAKTGLSVLMVLVGLFQDGLKKLDSRDFPGAIASFTQVIENKEADAGLRDRARFWRGVAYGKSGKADEAKADMANVLRETRNPAFREKALVAFTQVGGDPKTLLPKETPKEAFERTKKLGLDGDIAGFRKRIGGDFAAMLGMMDKIVGAEGHGDTAREIKQLCKEAAYGGSKIGEGKEFGTATVTGMIDRLALTVQLVAVGDEWQFCTLLDVKRTDGGAVGEQDVKTKYTNNLKQVSIALIMYATDNEQNMPKKLGAIAPYLANRAELLGYQDPGTGKVTPLLYHCVGNLSAVANPSSTYTVALPVAIDGQRIVAFADGHVQSIAEAAFLKKAKADGWKVGPKEPVKVEKDVTEKVEGLVKQLGDRKAAVRKTAYKELKELGEQAEPILEKHRNHPDPEIRMTVRKLLD
jgi:prepilin-type processing-associated H-X9-DG protein